jgi:hypothetical protein
LTEVTKRRDFPAPDRRRTAYQARRFTLLARAAKTVVYRAGEPVGTDRVPDDAA